MGNTPTSPEVARHRAVAVAGVLAAFVLIGVLSEVAGPSGETRVPPAGPALETALGSMAQDLGVPVRGPKPRQERAIDRVLSRVPYVSSGSRRRHEVALTFDDGPGPYTRRVVRQLRRLRVPATFFEVGRMMTAFPWLSRLVRRRFPVGDHTLSHPAMASLPRRKQRAQVLDQAARMRVFGDRFPRLFRPPYASFDAATLAVLRRHRMLMVLWSVDSEDYTRPGTRAIVRNVVSRVRAGSIVLMHDGGGPREQTVRAVPAIVHRLRRRGFRFVTVPQMLVDAPPVRAQRLPPGPGAG